MIFHCAECLVACFTDVNGDDTNNHPSCHTCGQDMTMEHSL